MQASTDSQHGRTHTQHLHSSAGQTTTNTNDAGQVLPGCGSLRRAAVTAHHATASRPQLTPSSHLRQVWVQKVIWDPLWHAVLLLLCDHIHLESEREGAAGVEPHLCPDLKVGCQSPTAASAAQRVMGLNPCGMHLVCCCPCIILAAHLPQHNQSWCEHCHATLRPTTADTDRTCPASLAPQTLPAPQ